jgi:pyruvate kinase
MAHAAVVASKELDTKTILCFTESGKTAQLISEYRPQASILAVTSTPATYQRLALYWGVLPLLIDGAPSTDETLGRMVQVAKDAGLIQRGEVVVITLGSRTHGASDIMKIHLVE